MEHITNEQSKNSKNQSLEITEEIMQAIEQGKLETVINILEETEGEEFIKLSKNLWKWVLTQILSKNEEKKKSNEFFKTFIEQEKTENREKEKPAVETTQTIEINQKSTPEPQDSKEKKSIDEIWNLYQENRKSNPIIAKEFLLKFIEQCKKEGIPFYNYMAITNINEKIANLGIPLEQIEKEKELVKQIKDIIRMKASPEKFDTLKILVDEFSKLYQDRGVLGPLYKGAYQSAINNHEKAIEYYNQVLKEEPWNQFALKSYSFSLIAQHNFSKAIRVLKKTLEYYPMDLTSKVRLAKTCIWTDKISQLRKLNDASKFLTNKDFYDYLTIVITNLEEKIDLEIHNLNSKSRKDSLYKKLELLKEELTSHQELQAQLSNYSSVTREMLEDYSPMIPYEAEVYENILNEKDGSIQPEQLNHYIQNIEIREDEKMLLYIAAAKICFIHQFPKYGEQYLTLVSKEHSKPSFVREQYNQCRKNKKLYLNQHK